MPCLYFHYAFNRITRLKDNKPPYNRIKPIRQGTHQKFKIAPKNNMLNTDKWKDDIKDDVRRRSHIAKSKAIPQHRAFLNKQLKSLTSKLPSEPCVSVTRRDRNAFGLSIFARRQRCISMFLCCSARWRYCSRAKQEGKKNDRFGKAHKS